MREIYPQESIEYKRQTNQKLVSDNKKFVMCFRNIFDTHICKTKRPDTLAKEHFFIPILEMETEETYAVAIGTLRRTHFHKPLMGISNILSIRETIADVSPNLSQIYIGGLIIDSKSNMLLVKEGDTYNVPNYKLTHSEAVYTKPVNQLLADTAFENLNRDLDIYPTIEGDNQAFDMVSGVIINSNKGNFDYVNKALFLIIYKVDDFDRLTIRHKEAGKQAIVLTLEQAASLVDHQEVSNPWVDYIITSIVK